MNQPQGLLPKRHLDYQQPQHQPVVTKPRLSQRQRWQCWSLCALGFAPILGAFFFNAGLPNPLPHCLFQAQFGFPSPSCGLTRSFMAFARGDIGAALSYHLFGPILFLAFMTVAIQSGLELLHQRPLNFGLRWLGNHLTVLIYGAPLFTFSFFGYYLLRLFIWFSENPSGGLWDNNALWQGLVTGAKLL